jgi:hypothetical protein
VGAKSDATIVLSQNINRINYFFRNLITNPPPLNPPLPSHCPFCSTSLTQSTMNAPYSTAAGAVSEPWHDSLWSTGDYPYTSVTQSTLRDSTFAPGQLSAADTNPHNFNATDDLAFSSAPITSAGGFTKLLNETFPVSQQRFERSTWTLPCCATGGRQCPAHAGPALVPFLFLPRSSVFLRMPFLLRSKFSRLPAGRRPPLDWGFIPCHPLSRRDILRECQCHGCKSSPLT